MKRQLLAVCALSACAVLAIAACHRAEPVWRTDDPSRPKLGTFEPLDNADQARALGLVEKVTGLKFTGVFPVYTYTPEDLAAEIADWQKEDPSYTPHNIMGFYSPERRAMFLVPEVAGNKRAFGLRVHEAAHALQDQHFGLAKLHDRAKTKDEQLAITALIEGHAVQVMIDALKETNPNVTRIADVQEKPDANLDDPAELTTFCYAAGTRFIQYIKEQNIGSSGLDAIGIAFTNPPKSPEEIRHPEKYIIRITCHE